MKPLIIALCTANGHTWCGPAEQTPPGCIDLHHFAVADMPRVLEVMRDTFWRNHIRGNYFDYRGVTPQRMAQRMTPELVLGVAA